METSCNIYEGMYRLRFHLTKQIFWVFTLVVNPTFSLFFEVERASICGF